MRVSLLAATAALASWSTALTIPTTQPGVYVLDRTVHNDLVRAPLECKPITVLFARGTWEPAGGRGGTLVGGKFIGGIKRAFPNQVAAQGIDYKASIMGYVQGGSEQGIQTLAALAKGVVAACPTTRLVVGGYSQGAQVVHAALELVPLEVSSRIAAVVTFGDPQIGRDITNIDPSRVDVLCQKNDPICKGLPYPVGSHLTYGVKHFMRDGVSFAIQKITNFTPGVAYTARSSKQPAVMYD